MMPAICFDSGLKERVRRESLWLGQIYIFLDPRRYGVLSCFLHNSILPQECFNELPVNAVNRKAPVKITVAPDSPA